ncbi:hypothetical protein F5I97DRAFT_490257 [Phlebopus sp. FC_14]|nr:hypothetical protein F5I97DRAFT_490257 [Phlebopus sp. FC_14]
MNNNTFSFYSNVFAFVMGGISLVGLAFSLTRPHLPSNKIKMLQALLEETEKIYVSAIEEGLLLDACFSDTTKTQLSGLQRETHELRVRVYGVTTFLQDCALMLSGLSKSIGDTCTKLDSHPPLRLQAKRRDVESSTIRLVLSLQSRLPPGAILTFVDPVLVLHA